MGTYFAAHCKSSQLKEARAAPKLVWLVTRAVPARSNGSRRATSAKWPRKFVANCNSSPSWVTCRVGGVITPALLMSRLIGRPSSIRPVAERRDRRQRREVQLPGGDAVAWGGGADTLQRGRALLRVADGQDDICASGGETTGEPKTNPVARAGDDERICPVRSGTMISGVLRDIDNPPN